MARGIQLIRVLRQLSHDSQRSKNSIMALCVCVFFFVCSQLLKFHQIKHRIMNRMFPHRKTNILTRCAFTFNLCSFVNEIRNMCEKYYLYYSVRVLLESSFTFKLSTFN